MQRLNNRLMPKPEASHSEALQAKYIKNWFDRLAPLCDDPKSKYTENVRYQNACAKIELVEDELNSYEKSHQIGGVSKNGTSLNCDRSGESEKKTISNDRNILIADILRILPEIRQHFL